MCYDFQFLQLIYRRTLQLNTTSCMNKKKEFYRYHFRIGGAVVHKGFTKNISATEILLRQSGRTTNYYGQMLKWSNGTVIQEGNQTTYDKAHEWMINNTTVSL